MTTRLLALALAAAPAAVAADPPKRTTLSDPAVKYTVPDKPYVVLRRGDVEAIVVDNRAVDDAVLPKHRAGYSGVAALRHTRQQQTLFVPEVAGLNFEHIHDGTTRDRPILFEPRNAPMELRRVGEHAAELYQKPTPTWGLESCQRYELLEDGTVELTIECIPRRQVFKNGYVGLFWASYIHRPESLDIHFRGHDEADVTGKPRWVKGVTPKHGELPTHLAVDDDRRFAHDPDFPLTLVFNRSKLRYAEPWYFGVCRGMAFVQMFRPADRVRLSQSPSGGGGGNPAWDFQFFIPDYKIDQRYQFVMRAAYLPFESAEQVERATRRHREALNKEPPMKPTGLTRERASQFARLALKGVRKEYPNKPEHVLGGAADVKGPKALHPAFYGCYDWHSAVHGHWMLVRLLRLFPDLPEAKEIRSVLAEHLTADNLRAEAAYFERPESRSFERPYGWAWLLKLAEELHGWDDPGANEWSRNLRPLAEGIAGRYVGYFPKQTYPIRTGVHANTAFGLAFAHDYARTVGHPKLRELVEERARTYFGADADVPAGWEPGGADFFSPSLMEADLMRRVLPADGFRAWFRKFLPGAAKGEPKALFVPATVTDRTDPQLVHLDGLNLSRAWCMKGVAAALAADDPARAALEGSAERHAEAGLKHVASGDYAGEHWLASFAVYLLGG